MRKSDRVQLGDIIGRMKLNEAEVITIIKIIIFIKLRLVMDY